MSRFTKILCATLLILPVISCNGSSTSSNEIVVATMLAPEQGATQSQLSYQAAADLAAEDLNQEFAKNGSPLKVKLIRGDLGTNPDIAFENMKKLYAQGIRLVVGPAESGYLIATQSFANANGMIIMSNASTAPTLAMENDNIYRLAPSDILLTKILANQIISDGFKKIILVSRKDLYGEDFRRYLQKALEAQKGEIVGELIYEPRTTAFKQQVETLRDQIKFAQPAIDPKDVALVSISFDEIVPLVKEMIAQDAALLGAFRWYGSNGTVQIVDVVQDATVAAFLANAQFSATSTAMKDVVKFKSFTARVNAVVAGDVDIYAPLAYDSVTLLVKTAAQLKAKKLESIEAWRTNLPLVAEKLEGITGNLALNKEGDRQKLSYGLWSIDKNSETYSWKLNRFLDQ